MVHDNTQANILTVIAQRTTSMQQSCAKRNTLAKNNDIRYPFHTHEVSVYAPERMTSLSRSFRDALSN